VWRHEESRHNNILPQDQNTCRSPAVQIATGQNICCPYSIPHVDLLFYPRFNNRWTVRANKRRTHRFRLHPVQKESSFQHAYKKPFKVSSKIQHDYGELIQYLQFDMLIRNHSCLYRIFVVAVLRIQKFKTNGLIYHNWWFHEVDSTYSPCTVT
jgi:hypothetical protein